jgi:DNA-binding NarL/FixJ family response regulator
MDAGEANLMRSNKDHPKDELTNRELEVLKLVADGDCNKKIAVILVVSVRTVETHIRHILEKLGVSSRTEAAAWYWQHKNELES